MPDIRVSVGAAGNVIPIETMLGDIHTIVNIAAPSATADDSAILKARLLQIDRGSESAALYDHLDGLLRTGRRTPGVIVIAGPPDALVKGFAQRFIDHDIADLPLTDRRGRFHAWRSLSQITRSVLADLDPAAAAASYSKSIAPEQFLSDLIRKRKHSVWIGFEAPIQEIRASIDLLDAWLRYFADECAAPKAAPHMLLVFLCIRGPEPDEGFKAWVESRLTQVKARDAVKVVRLTSIPRDELQPWIDAYNEALVGGGRPRFPRDTVERVYGAEQALDHDQLCRELETILRQEQVALTARIGGGLTQILGVHGYDA